MSGLLAIHRFFMQLALVAALAVPLPAAADWLDLRRQGPTAVVAAAHKAAAPLPWLATYSATLPSSHPLHGLKLTVARAPGPKGSPGPGPMLLRFEAPASLRGVGVTVQAGKAWLRLPGQKAAQIMTPEALFATVAQIGVPLAVFLVPDLVLPPPAQAKGKSSAAQVPLYDLQSEGEFGDFGILRLRPHYEAGPGLQPMKAGVSKAFHVFALAEVTDLQGKAVAGALWLDPALEDGLVAFSRLRLRPAAGDPAALELERTDLRQGKAAGRLVFGPKALR